MHILSTFSLAWSTSLGRSRMIPNEDKPEVSSDRSHLSSAAKGPLWDEFCLAKEEGLCMWRWGSPRVHKGVALSISPP